MTVSEKKIWLDRDDGLAPYLRLKDKGMPKDKLKQIEWLLLNGSGCGFCKVCRDNPCNIKDGESCTTNIANYIRDIVLEENEQEIRNKAIDDFAELLKGNLIRKYANANLTQQYVALQVTDWCNEITEQLKAGEK